MNLVKDILSDYSVYLYPAKVMSPSNDAVSPPNRRRRNFTQHSLKHGHHHRQNYATVL
jgi:hypothetical protein